MTAQSNPPSIAQLCARTRRLIASAPSPRTSVGLRREQVIRELRLAAQRHRAAGPSSQAHPHVITH